MISAPEMSEEHRGTWALSWLAVALAALGMLLRLVQYLHNSNLWHDETTIAIDLMGRSVADLFHPSTYYNQTAPVGFLILEKLLGQAGNYSELSLRFVPFVSGSLAVVLVYLVARRVLSPAAGVVAVALFAVCEPAIQFSAEVKQYSSDVAIVTLLYWQAFNRQGLGMSLGRGLAGAIVAAIVVWFSSPAVFVLAAIALFMVAPKAWERKWGELARFAALHAVWVLSFAAMYVVYLRPLASHDLIGFWRGGAAVPGAPERGAFLPLPPTSMRDLTWISRTFFEVFGYPGGLRLGGLAAFAFLVGCASLGRRNRRALGTLLAPIALALLASGLGKYPFIGRTILFIVPAVLLLVAEGAEVIRRVTWDRSRVVGGVFLFLLFAHPVFAAYEGVRFPREVTQMKPALAHVRAHREPGDVVYVNAGSARPFDYYFPTSGLGERNLVRSLNTHPAWDWRRVSEEAAMLRERRRVWTIFSGVYRLNGLDEESLFCAEMEEHARLLETFRTRGVTVRLYETNPPPETHP